MGWRGRRKRATSGRPAPSRWGGMIRRYYVRAGNATRRWTARVNPGMVFLNRAVGEPFRPVVCRGEDCEPYRTGAKPPRLTRLFACNVLPRDTKPGVMNRAGLFPPLSTTPRAPPRRRTNDPTAGRPRIYPERFRGILCEVLLAGRARGGARYARGEGGGRLIRLLRPHDGVLPNRSAFHAPLRSLTEPFGKIVVRR